MREEERESGKEGESSGFCQHVHIFVISNPNQVKKEKKTAKVMCEILIMKKPVHLCVTEIIL